MTVIEILYLSTYLFVALYSAFTDLKKGIVKNNVLLVCTVISLILNFVYYYKNASLIKTFLMNQIIIIFISLFLFKVGVWGGGDCKLLICLSLLYPAKYYISSLTFAPFTYVLIIAFSISFIYLIYDSIKSYFNKKDSFKVQPIGDYFNIDTLKNMIIIYMFFYSTDAILYYFFNLININNQNIILQFINIMIVICFDFQYLKNKKIIYGLIFIFFFIFFLSIRYTGIQFNVINTIFIFLIFLVKMLAGYFNYSKIKSEDLKEGMILSKYSILLMLPSKIKNLPTSMRENMNSRLTQNQVDACKKWAVSKKGKDELIIVKKIPFAIFISISSLIYIVIGLFINL